MLSAFVSHDVMYEAFNFCFEQTCAERLLAIQDLPVDGRPNISVMVPVGIPPPSQLSILDYIKYALKIMLMTSGLVHTH